MSSAGGAPEEGEGAGAGEGEGEGEGAGAGGCRGLTEPTWLSPWLLSARTVQPSVGLALSGSRHGLGAQPGIRSLRIPAMALSRGDVRSSLPDGIPSGAAAAQTPATYTARDADYPSVHLTVRPGVHQAQSCAIALRSPASERYSPDIHPRGHHVAHRGGATNREGGCTSDEDNLEVPWARLTRCALSR